MGGWFSKRDRSIKHYNQGVEAWESFQEDRKKSDLDKAIRCHTKALQLRSAGPPPHPDRAASLLCLALAAWAQCELAGVSEENSSNAIKLYEESIKLSSPSGDPVAYDKLGQIYLFRFQHPGGSSNDLQQAIKNYREVLLRRPEANADRAKALINLSIVYTLENQETSSTEAIAHLREAVTICRPEDSPGHQYLQMSLIRLASAFNARYNHTMALSDLREVINTSEAALPFVAGPSRASALINLSNAIWTLAEHETKGHAEDLEKAIGYSREGVELAKEDVALQTQARLTLANALVSRNSRATAVVVAEMDEAIGEYKAAIEAGESESPTTLSSLANAICARCDGAGEDTEQEVTYEASISYNEKALQKCQIEDPVKAKIANNLASTYVTRFNLSSRQDDLHRAMNYYRTAIEGSPVDGEDRAYYLERITEGEALLTSLKVVDGPGTPRPTLITRRQSTVQRKGSIQSQTGDMQPGGPA